MGVPKTWIRLSAPKTTVTFFGLAIRFQWLTNPAGALVRPVRTRTHVRAAAEQAQVRAAAIVAHARMHIAGLPLARHRPHVQCAAQAAPDLDALRVAGGPVGPVHGLVVPVRPEDGVADQRQSVRVAGVLDEGGALPAVQVGRLDAIVQRIGPE